jgi:methionine sulfoxide reductase heme-binding subunit
MQSIKQHGLWTLLNTIALLIFLSLLSQIFKTINDIRILFLFDAYLSNYDLNIGSVVFQESGRWAIRFLLISLAISPLYYLFGWKKLIGLRKSAGLWAVAFTLIHLRLFFADITWGKIVYQSYFWIGLAGFIILALLALTSHPWAMRWMKKWWKRLHRLVYIAGILVVLHSILAIEKVKLSNLDEIRLEMRIYLVILLVLLVLRISWLRRLIRIPKRKIQSKREYVVTS